jgi:hypothetical protein
MAKAAPANDAVLGRIRIPFVQRATLACRGHDEEAFIVDLGLEGVFVERSEPLPRGERVGVRFLLPGNAIPIAVPCEVAWSKGRHDAPDGMPAGIGLHFASLEPADRERLSDFLAAWCRRHGKARRFTRPWPL